MEREAAAIRRAADAEQQSGHLSAHIVELTVELEDTRRVLQDLVRAVDTAPLSRVVNVDQIVSQAMGRGVREAMVRAPHLDYRPLADAMAAATRELGR